MSREQISEVHAGWEAIARKLGINPTEHGQFYTIPAQHPFVLEEPGKIQKGSRVTKIILGFADPNVSPAYFNKNKESGPENPYVVYHSADSKGKVVWFYPYFKDGEVNYFSSSERGIVDYLSKLFEKQTNEVDIKKIDRKISFRTEMTLFKKSGNPKNSVESAARSLYSGANLELSKMRYRGVWDENDSLKGIVFGTKEGFAYNGKSVLYMPTQGKNDNGNLPGWFIISKDGIQRKVGPAEASKTLSLIA